MFWSPRPPSCLMKKKLTIKEAQAQPCPECGAVKKSPCVDLPSGKVYRSTVHDKRMEGESHHRP